MQPLLDGRSSWPGADLMIHADNSRPHIVGKTLKSFREKHLGIAPHPPYSPNLTPSDSFLFGHIRHALEGAEFPSEETLLATVQSVLSRFTTDTLRAVLAKWVERLN
jgi:hypothetical protein